jgi:Fur family ferric uptake transcriptional regulator
MNADVMPEASASRRTRQRQIILEELRALRSHPTAAEVYAAVRRRLPRISLGTVYRNLERLAAAGEILKLRLGSAQSRFDGDTSQHYHVRCTHCGRMDDLAIKPLRAIASAAASISDYQISGYRLEFVGVCGRCAAARSARRRAREQPRSLQSEMPVAPKGERQWS